MPISWQAVKSVARELCWSELSSIASHAMKIGKLVLETFYFRCVPFGSRGIGLIFSNFGERVKHALTAPMATGSIGACSRHKACHYSKEARSRWEYSPIGPQATAVARKDL